MFQVNLTRTAQLLQGTISGCHQIKSIEFWPATKSETVKQTANSVTMNVHLPFHFTDLDPDLDHHLRIHFIDPGGKDSPWLCTGKFTSAGVFVPNQDGSGGTNEVQCNTDYPTQTPPSCKT